MQVLRMRLELVGMMKPKAACLARGIQLTPKHWIERSQVSTLDGLAIQVKRYEMVMEIHSRCVECILSISSYHSVIEHGE